MFQGWSNLHAFKYTGEKESLGPPKPVFWQT